MRAVAYKVKTLEERPSLLHKLQLGEKGLTVRVETEEELEWALRNGVPTRCLLVGRELAAQLPTELLRELIYKGPKPSRIAALMEINDKQLLIEFLKRDEWKYAIRNPHLDGEVVDVLPELPHYFLAGDARSPDVLRAVFRKYGESREIAQNPYTPADVLLAFKDRAEVVGNPNFPASEVLKMGSIPLQFFGREDVPVEVFVQAWNKIDIDHEILVLHDRNFFPRISSNASLALIERGEFIDKLAKYSPHSKVLQKLFDLKGEQVARKLVQNKHCPVSLLVKLLHAEDPKIRRRARGRLLEKKLKEFGPYVEEILELLESSSNNKGGRQ